MIDNKIEVDLIYLDPPFNSSRIYNIIFQNKGVTAQQKAFHDAWTLTCQNRQLLFDFESVIDKNEDISPLVRDFLKAWLRPLKDGKLEDNKMIIYLIYMTERLSLMKKVLKDTGSIYVHCDPTASHYLKIIMDGLFGRDNFRNEIVWYYSDTPGRGTRWFSKKHDLILFYTKTDDWVFNREDVLVPIREESKKRYDYIRKIGGREYLGGNTEGKTPDTVWHIPAVKRNSKVSFGYNTQKPIKLLDRIIKASCPEGGVVFDPFCGCGTTLHSAILNRKKWIGCDISTEALKIIKKRIEDLHVYQDKDYLKIDGSPETRNEYEELNPYEKQDWLINQIGGFPNPKKSRDKGIDGEMTIHLGFDKEGRDRWGKVVFSVKTGNQCNPEMIRELIGTMKINNFEFGGLILDKDPTDEMINLAEKQGEYEYVYADEIPPQRFKKVQIITADEVIDKKEFILPPSLTKIKSYREKKEQLKLFSQNSM